MRPRVADERREVLEIPVGLVRLDGIDRGQAAVVRVRLLFILRIQRPQLELAGRRIEPPRVEVGTVLERVGETAKVDPLQVEHVISFVRSIPPGRA